MGASLKRLLTLLLILFLIYPFIILLSHGYQLSLPDMDRLLVVGAWSVIQSALSASLSIGFGVVGCLGLFSLRSKLVLKGSQLALMLPSFIPTLFVVLSYINVLDFLGASLFGLHSVIICHVLVSCGLVAVLLHQQVSHKLGNYCEIGLVSGAGRFIFFRKVFLPLMKIELLALWFFVFSMCFSSFTVPQILGGRTPLSLDVLIYENIKIYSDMGKALGVVVVQFLCVLTLVLLFKKPKVKAKPSHKSMKILSFRPGLFVGLFLTAVIIFGDFFGVLTGFVKLYNSQIDRELLLGFCVNTAFISLMSGLLSLLLLMITAFVCESRRVSQLMMAFIAPSGVLVGFSLLLGAEFLAPEWRVILGFLMINTSVLYRMGMYSYLQLIRPQLVLARVASAGVGLTFFRVIFPQVFTKALHLSAIASFWAAGEYTVSTVVSESDFTLALWVKSLMASYRLPEATAASWAMIFIGFLCYLFFQGASSVFSKKTL